MTDEYPSRPKASHIAVRRARGQESVKAADGPITFDPVFGQVFVADLQGCDEENCYYDYPTGIA